MLEKIKRARDIAGNIISQKYYFMIFLVVTIASFIVFYILTVATVADWSLKIFIMMSGYAYTISQLILLGIIAGLFGVYVSLFVYKIEKIRKVSKSGTVGSSGLIAGLFSAGCPTCGSILFGLLGAPLALLSFPFDGLELKVLSIALLSFSIYSISLNIENACFIKNYKEIK